MASDSVADVLVLNEMNQPDTDGAQPLLPPDLAMIGHIEVDMVAEVGHVALTIDKVFSLKRGDVVAMREAVNSPLTLRLNGKPVAKGRLVAVDEKFGIEITALA